MGPAHNSIHWCVMKLARWGYVASAVLLASTLAFTSCDKNKENREENKEENFSYTGKWATVKVMNKEISKNSTQEEVDAVVKASISLIDVLFLPGTKDEVARKKDALKELIPAMVDFARGITITVTEEGNACNVTFAGLDNGASGTWKEQDGKLLLTLSKLSEDAINQLRTKAENSPKGKISYAFAISINASNEPFTLTKADNGNIKWALTSDFLTKAYLTMHPNETAEATKTLVDLFVGTKLASKDIEFKKVN